MEKWRTDEEIMAMAVPKGFAEKKLLDIIKKNFGEFATTKEICDYFKISKSYIYQSIEDRMLVAFKVGTKNLIFTPTLINIIKRVDC